MALNYGTAFNNDSSFAYRPWLFDQTQLVEPSITLIGDGVSVNLNDSYVEPGYTATDGNDGDITNSVVVTGSVNTSVAGVYTLTYTVTNSVGNSDVVTRLVTVVDFWEYVPPQARIFDMSLGTQHVTKDPDGSLSYWLDFSGLIGGQTIDSVVVSADLGITVDCTGLNTQTETDNNSATYTAGQLIGLFVSGGVANAVYRINIRYTLSGGDVDDRSIVYHVIEQ